MDLASLSLLDAMATVINHSKTVTYAKDAGQMIERYPSDEELAKAMLQVVLLQSHGRLKKALEASQVLPEGSDVDELAAKLAMALAEK